MSLYPSPPSTLTGDAQRRVKRRRTQNDSSEESQATVSSTLSEEGFTAERYRVGVPPLQLLPLISQDVDTNSQEFLRFNLLLPTIEDILTARRVNVSEEEGGIELCFRAIQDEPQDHPTILVNAKWDDHAGEAWLLAVEDIRTLIVSDPAMRSVNVEIIAWQAEEARAMDVVEFDHPFVAAWPKINPLLHGILENYPRLEDNWRAIDVMRLGFNRAPSLPVIISITVDWVLDPRDWLAAETEIKALLTREGFRDPTEEDIIDGEYTLAVGIGSDMGPAKYFQRVPSGVRMDGPYATFGGYIHAHTNQGPPKKLGLSNYHAMRETMESFCFVDADPKDASQGGEKAVVPVNSELYNVDRKGMRPNYSNRTNMMLESPSRRKHNYTMHDMQQKIRHNQAMLPQLPPDKRLKLRNQIESLQKQYNQKKKFFDEGNNELGVPWMCSGYKSRTSDNGRLDWALIEVKSHRMGNNTIPDASVWGKSVGQNMGVPVVCNELIQGMASCADGKKHGSLYKVGARTGATAATFSHIKSDVRMDYDKDLGLGYSSEYAFVGGSKHAFTLPGDSGSLVFTQDGEWLGLVFGGPRKKNVLNQAWTYITDAQEVLNHMHQLSKQKIRFELANS